MTLYSGADTFWGRTKDVSRGGLCADIAQSIPLGTNIEVDIQLIFEDAESEALRIPARVVWCTNHDDSYQVGVSFRALTAEQIQYLTLFLKYLGEDEPMQRMRRPSNLDKRFG